MSLLQEEPANTDTEAMQKLITNFITKHKAFYTASTTNNNLTLSSSNDKT